MSVSQFPGDNYCSEFLHIEWYIFLFCIGLAVGFIKDLYQFGRQRFFSNAFNYITLATVILFSYYDLVEMFATEYTPFDLEFPKYLFPMKTLFAPSVLSVGVLLAFFYNLFFMQANPSIGPLFHAFTKMLIDVAKFFSYLYFIFLAFAVSFTKLRTEASAVKRSNETQEQGSSLFDDSPLKR